MSTQHPTPPVDRSTRGPQLQRGPHRSQPSDSNRRAPNPTPIRTGRGQPRAAQQPMGDGGGSTSDDGGGAGSKPAAKDEGQVRAGCAAVAAWHAVDGVERSMFMFMFVCPGRVPSGLDFWTSKNMSDPATYQQTNSTPHPLPTRTPPVPRGHAGERDGRHHLARGLPPLGHVQGAFCVLFVRSRCVGRRVRPRPLQRPVNQSPHPPTAPSPNTRRGSRTRGASSRAPGRSSSRRCGTKASAGSTAGSAPS